MANRQRSGACTAFCPRTHGDHINRQFGICAHTNGLDMPGTANRDDINCKFRPSKFKKKGQS